MKRIVICADGTWQSPESDNPTHILRLAQVVASEDGQGNKQVVSYDWGGGLGGRPFHRRRHRQGHHGHSETVSAKPTKVATSLTGRRFDTTALAGKSSSG